VAELLSRCDSYALFVYIVERATGERVEMEAHVTVMEMSPPTHAGSDLAAIASLDQAIAGVTKLPPELLALPGMSGHKYRCFINNLIEQLPEVPSVAVEFD
jgi:hypothetical protein